MGWEVGEGFGMENTCTPVADSSQCMAKPTQYCKVKKKQKTHSFQYIYGEIFTRRKSCLIKSKSGCCRRLKQGEDANKKTQKIKLKNN